MTMTILKSDLNLQPQPGECGSIIDTGGVFTLQEDILACDCDAFGYALKVDGQGTVLNLNGHTVECTDADTGAAIIEVIGKANTVMGPGTGKYIIFKSCFFLI